MKPNAVKGDLVTQENKIMRKFFTGIIFFGWIVTGCHTSKQTQHVLRDSSIATSPATTLKPVDSAAILKQQLSDILTTPLNYTTFYGRAKANFNSPQASGNAMVYIKMKKDSIIWISVTGPLNIEGARVLITQDSIKILNKLEGSLQLSGIDQLQKITKLPLTFNDLQNVILGRAVFINGDSSGVAFEVKKDSIIVTAANNLLTSVYSFTKNNLQLTESSFQTSNNPSVTGADITYNNYSPADVMNFSTDRNITITGSLPSTVQLSFKEYNFNQPQSFVFTVSKNYRIKYE
jgi:hypothetical protein